MAHYSSLGGNSHYVIFALPHLKDLQNFIFAPSTKHNWSSEREENGNFAPIASWRFPSRAEHSADIADATPTTTTMITISSLT